jgi:hypothetical protein
MEATAIGDDLGRVGRQATATAAGATSQHLERHLRGRSQSCADRAFGLLDHDPRLQRCPQLSVLDPECVELIPVRAERDDSAILGVAHAPAPTPSSTVTPMLPAKLDANGNHTLRHSQRRFSIRASSWRRRFFFAPRCHPSQIRHDREFRFSRPGLLLHSTL